MGGKRRRDRAWGRWQSWVRGSMAAILHAPECHGDVGDRVGDGSHGGGGGGVSTRFGPYVRKEASVGSFVVTRGGVRAVGVSASPQEGPQTCLDSNESFAVHCCVLRNLDVPDITQPGRWGDGNDDCTGSTAESGNVTKVSTRAALRDWYQCSLPADRVCCCWRRGRREQTAGVACDVGCCCSET